MNKLSKRLGAMAMVLTMTASYVPAVFAEDAEHRSQITLDGTQ